MTETARPSVAPILAEDAAAAAEFLSLHLNPRVMRDAWLALLQPPWPSAADNSGFQLRSGGELVGVYAAVYSTRMIADEERVVCNLAAFCVREDHRAHSLRLVRAVLAQKGMVFTDLSPSGNVPAMNERLGFAHLDTGTRLVVNSPALSRRHHVTDDPDALASVLSRRDAVVYRDHRAAPAARHLVVTSRDDRYAYLLYRRDARKRVRVFASPLYAGGDRTLLESAWPLVGNHLLRRGLAATLAEPRVLGFRPRGPGRDLSRPRPKMYRGAGLAASDIDYLYSELTLLEW